MENVFANFLLESGLYDSMEINKDNIGDLIDLVDGKVRINCYCKKCRESRVFLMNPIKYYYDDESGCDGIFVSKLINHHTDRPRVVPTQTLSVKRNSAPWVWRADFSRDALRILVFKFVCAMDNRHNVDYIILTSDHELKKIGQYPSVADISLHELDKYKKTVSHEDLSELHRAMGLHAHGIGVGSYVYLRRVLERIIEKAKDMAVADGEFDIDAYNNSKVGERIKQLKDHLPDFLNDNSVIYGIISKGIHGLTEDECIQYFPVLLHCIFMILDEWEEKRQREIRQKDLSRALSKIATDIK